MYITYVYICIIHQLEKKHGANPKHIHGTSQKVDKQRRKVMNREKPVIFFGFSPESLVILLYPVSNSDAYTKKT